jgi:predicted nucleotidyltransferase
MRVDRNDRIAGLPAPIAREVMRLFNREVPERLLGFCVKDDDREFSEIAQALASEGLLEFDHTDADGEDWWRPTIKGKALAQASFRPPVTRGTAERLLKEVIERAQCFNAAPAHLVEIAELVVFGSYLDPTVDRLGDLDLAVKFRELRADLSADEYMKKRLAYSRASGRQFNNFNAELSWPENEALLALRKRSPTINITIQDVSILTDRWEVVFRADDPAVD